MDTLRIDDAGAVRTITLNRPEVRNAMNRAMLSELVQALEAANLDQDVRCVVLTGEGPVFCAGGDIKDLFTDTNPVTIRHMLSQRIRPMARALFTMDKPVHPCSTAPSPVPGWRCRWPRTWCWPAARRAS